MEETKQKTAKFEPTQQAKPLTEEELKQKLNIAVNDNRSLIQRLQQAEEYINSLQTQNLFTYISFLFKVVEHPEMYSSGFVERCVSDVEDLMTRLHSLAIVENNEEDNDGSAQTK